MVRSETVQNEKSWGRALRAHLPESDPSARPPPRESVCEGGSRARRPPSRPRDRVRPDGAHTEPQTRLRAASEQRAQQLPGSLISGWTSVLNLTTSDQIRVYKMSLAIHAGRPAQTPSSRRKCLFPSLHWSSAADARRSAFRVM